MSRIKTGGIKKGGIKSEIKIGGIESGIKLSGTNVVGTLQVQRGHGRSFLHLHF